MRYDAFDLINGSELPLGSRFIFQIYTIYSKIVEWSRFNF